MMLGTTPLGTLPTSPADPLVVCWDYGSSITLADTEAFMVDFGSNALFTLA
jgi:hypothetical protein